MPSDGYQKLVECLEPLSVTGRDYRSLADRMGYTNQYIQYLGSLNSPVSELIRKYINQTPDRKIAELVSLLEDMQRYDVLLDLQPFIGESTVKSHTHTCIFPSQIHMYKGRSGLDAHCISRLR